MLFFTLAPSVFALFGHDLGGNPIQHRSGFSPVVFHCTFGRSFRLMCAPAAPIVYDNICSRSKPIVCGRQTFFLSAFYCTSAHAETTTIALCSLSFPPNVTPFSILENHTASATWSSMRAESLEFLRYKCVREASVLVTELRCREHCTKVG